MILYDFKCSSCGDITESIQAISTTEIECPTCGKEAHRIISCSGVNTQNEDAAWIRTVVDVVDKESKAPHVVEFRRNPTRTNYKRWMALEGLRPLESHEYRGSKAGQDRVREITDIVLREQQKKRSINL